MFDFFNKFFKPAPPSGATAKERLRLVLLSDHLALAPDVVDALKADLMEVISRYVEIDQAHADVTFERREGDIAMLASIPITGVRNRRDDAPESPSGAPPAPEPAAEEPVAAAQPPVAEAEQSDAESDVEAEVVAPGGHASEAVGDDGPASPVQRRRRRRRRAASVPPLNAPAQA